MTSPDTFTSAWKFGWRRVYSIALGRALLLRKASSDIAPRHWWIELPWLLVATQLPLLFIWIRWPASAVSWKDAAWVSGLDVLTGLMLFAARRTWWYAQANGSRLDLMLEASPDAPSEVTDWLKRSLSVLHQLPVSLLAMTGAYTFFVFRAGPSDLHLGVAFILAIAANDFVGGNVVYWLVVPPAIIRRIGRCSNVRYRWHHPGATPGVRLLAEGFGLASLFLLVGAALILIPSFTTHQPLAEISTAVVAGLLLVSLRVAFSYVALYFLIRREKQKVLDAIEAKIPPLTDVLDESNAAATAELANVYDWVDKTNHLPLTSAAMVQYAAALLGVFGGLVVSIATKG